MRRLLFIMSVRGTINNIQIQSLIFSPQQYCRMGCCLLDLPVGGVLVFFWLPQNNEEEFQEVCISDKEGVSFFCLWLSCVARVCLFFLLVSQQFILFSSVKCIFLSQRSGIECIFGLWANSPANGPEGRWTDVYPEDVSFMSAPETLATTLTPLLLLSFIYPCLMSTINLCVLASTSAY